MIEIARLPRSLPDNPPPHTALLYVNNEDQVVLRYPDGSEETVSFAAPSMATFQTVSEEDTAWNGTATTFLLDGSAYVASLDTDTLPAGVLLTAICSDATNSVTIQSSSSTPATALHIFDGGSDAGSLFTFIVPNAIVQFIIQDVSGTRNMHILTRISTSTVGPHP